MTARLLLVLASLFAMTAAAAQAPPSTTPASQEAPAKPPKNDYSNPATWLCRPDLPAVQNACAVDLSTTVISADGRTTIEPFTANPNAPIDCFYVYPTVSNDPGGNATMQAEAEEKSVVRAQFARFASVCKPYAPLYRQATLTALRAAATGHPIPVDRNLVYDDVLDAWKYYLAHDNHGRGVVLIGHSQGSGVLYFLIKNEIDGKPIQSQIVSALLLGMNLAVPVGKDVGGAFQNVPLCRSATQTGCVISYVAFRASDPPPANTRFGKVDGPGIMAACVNPASLSGASGELHAYLGAKTSGLTIDESVPGPWLKAGTPVTPFVSVPGLLTAQCVNDEHGSYLAVTVHPDPAGQRANDIAGDVVVNGNIRHEWGLHLIDINVAQGNLLDIVSKQSISYQSPKK